MQVMHIYRPARKSIFGWAFGDDQRGFVVVGRVSCIASTVLDYVVDPAWGKEELVLLMETKAWVQQR